MDSQGNIGLYGSSGGGLGYDASIGLEYAANESYSSSFTIKGIRGASADYSFSIIILDFSTGGNANSTNSLFTKTGNLYNSNAIGISASPLLGASTRLFENMGVVKLFNCKNR